MRTAKVGIAIGCLLLAVFLYWWRSPSGAEGIPDTKESESQWLCRACEKPARLTARKVNALMSAVNDVPPLHCPSCGKRDLWQAFVCPKDQTVYFTEGVPDATGRCPKCFPEDKIKRKTVEEAPTGIGIPVRKKAPNL